MFCLRIRGYDCFMLDLGWLSWGPLNMTKRGWPRPWTFGPPADLSFRITRTEEIIKY